MRFRTKAVCFLALACILSGTFGRFRAAGAQSTATEMPKPSDLLVDAVGVNTHFNYVGDAYVLNWPAVSASLIDMGIRHIRDGGAPNPAYEDRLTTLGQHGIRHSAMFFDNATPAAFIAELSAYAPYVDFVEPHNEYDGLRNRNPDWASGIASIQRTLYTTVRSDPRFSGITILGPSLANAARASAIGPLDAYQDAGNLHFSPCFYNPGTSISSQALPYWHTFLRASAAAKPIWSTEVEYSDDMTRRCSLPDDIIAKYDVRTVLERWNAGEPRVYFYEFLDVPRESVFGSVGLLHADATPKPQYAALRSMLHFLNDRGPAFKPKPLQYSLSGNINNVHHLLLQKRDGRYELLVWLEVPAWDAAARTPLAIPKQPVSLSLPPSIAGAKVFTYTPSWSLASAPVPIRNGVAQIQVSDAVSFVELSP